MVRLSQQLHATREPAPLRPAVALLLLRDGMAGLEVLMTLRSSGASVVPDTDVYVFPGGHVSEVDAQARPIALRRRTQSRAQLTHAITAVRESFEKLGVLLGEHADGVPVDSTDVLTMDRHAQAEGGFLAQCVARGLRLWTDRIFTLAHWVTDDDSPEYSDMLCLVARMPTEQTAAVDTAESSGSCWISPSDALERYQQGAFPMPFSAARTLRRLAAHETVDAVLTACAGEQPLWSSYPRAGWLKERQERFMEHESAYGELAMVCPGGQILHRLDWQTEQPVPLLRHVIRLTAPNPGLMTGPGTNSYIVGDAHSGYIVIDPGPNDFDHVGRIWRATQGKVHAIVCTHSHADHAPGALPLRAMCKETNPPILGLPSAPNARSAARFVPDRVLHHLERLELHGRLLEDGSGRRETHTLRTIHTPGHAANHLCLVLEEDGLLFSGDHILNGSTTVIDPPDGNMTEYLASLDLLDAACDELRVDFILPAHGYVLGHARRAIAELKAHRMWRESRVAAAMDRLPVGDLDDWLPIAYSDLPQHLWPAAARSLQAHVDRIRELALQPGDLPSSEPTTIPSSL